MLESSPLPCIKCGNCCYDGRCSLRRWIPWNLLDYEFTGRCEFLLDDNRCEVIAVVLDPSAGVHVDEGGRDFIQRTVRGICDATEKRQATRSNA